MDDNIHLSPEFLEYIKARMEEQTKAQSTDATERLFTALKSLATSTALFYKALRKEGVPRGVAAALSQTLLLKLINPQ